MYVHCLTPIFETMRLLRMKSLGECVQLNYGAPRGRIRSNGLQMKELRNLQNSPDGIKPQAQLFYNLGTSEKPRKVNSAQRYQRKTDFRPDSK
ncbi:hypothetical protein IGI04_042251 [Brassica rapa subsp. trilocularis]|uniref:Uncharacterized protein n=1 Tax=Brassica rapa subsp. trilocularis TaxID=1813537 RepID=A0ABQ7KKI5_BRACM|nr:hypothetical protein IGI04_042251 [Brassica rapa subsp. trilocularis]